MVAPDLRASQEGPIATCFYPQRFGEDRLQPTKALQSAHSKKEAVVLECGNLLPLFSRRPVAAFADEASSV